MRIDLSLSRDSVIDGTSACTARPTGNPRMDPRSRSREHQRCSAQKCDEEKRICQPGRRQWTEQWNGALPESVADDIPRDDDQARPRSIEGQASLAPRRAKWSSPAAPIVP